MDSSRTVGKESNEKQKSAGMQTARAKDPKKNYSSRANKSDDLPTKEDKSSKNQSIKQMDTKSKGALKPNSRSRSPMKSTSGDDFEPPTMSFETYLNYDQVSCRRKRRASTNRQVTTTNSSPASRKSMMSGRYDEEETLKLDDCSETSRKKAS